MYRYRDNPAQPPSCAVGAHVTLKEGGLKQLKIKLFNLLGSKLYAPLSELTPAERILKTTDFGVFSEMVQEVVHAERRNRTPDKEAMRKINSVLSAAQQVGSDTHRRKDMISRTDYISAKHFAMLSSKYRDHRDLGGTFLDPPGSDEWTTQQIEDWFKFDVPRRPDQRIRASAGVKRILEAEFWASIAGGVFTGTPVLCQRQQQRDFGPRPEITVCETGWVMSNTFMRNGRKMSFGPLLYYSAMQVIRDDIKRLRREGKEVGWNAPSATPVGIMSDRSDTVSIHAQRFWEGLFERTMDDRQIDMFLLPLSCRHESCEELEYDRQARGLGPIGESASYLNYGFYASRDLKIGNTPIDMIALQLLYESWGIGYQFYPDDIEPYSMHELRTSIKNLDAGDADRMYFELKDGVEEWGRLLYRNLTVSSYVKCEDTLEPARFLRKKRYKGSGPVRRMPENLQIEADSWEDLVELPASSSRRPLSTGQLDELIQAIQTRNNPYGDDY